MSSIVSPLCFNKIESFSLVSGTKGFCSKSSSDINKDVIVPAAFGNSPQGNCTT